jgi:hypothetical protein
MKKSGTERKSSRNRQAKATFTNDSAAKKDDDFDEFLSRKQPDSDDDMSEYRDLVFDYDESKALV